MFLKKVVFCLFFVLVSYNSLAQNSENKWALGIGGGAIDFAPQEHLFPDEDYSLQIPSVNLTRYLNNGFSVGGGLTLTALQKVDGLFANTYNLLFVDMFARYDFNTAKNRLVPYAQLGGGGLVKEWTERALSINLGVGATYWLTHRFGLNVEVAYRNVPALYDNIFDSHTQFSGRLIISLDQHTHKRFGNGGSGFCNY